MAFYLGIDGGGSKTTCMVGDEKSSLATAASGPSNIVRVGETEALRSLHEAVNAACTAAGISPQQIAHICVGAAGAARPEIATLIHSALSELVAGEVEVTGDMHIALEAAFAGGPGIIVIAGTGSIAYGRDSSGKVTRAGGWGFAISDEGSAHWIGRTAIADVLRARDRQEAEIPLAASLQKTWAVDSLDALAAVACAHPTPNFAALLPAVLACADANDELSRHILGSAAAELAQLAAIILPILFPRPAGPESNLEPVPLAMVGGVFRHSKLVRELFYNEIAKIDRRVAVRPQVIEPVEGALWLARKNHS